MFKFLDYATGAVTNELETDPNNPHYLTCCQFLGKDFVLVGGTDRSIIKIFDRHNLNTLATIKDVAAVYDLEASAKSQIVGHRFIVSSKMNILNVDFNK